MPDEIKPKDGKQKRNLLSFKKKTITNNYGKYSGVVDDSGKAIDNPTVGQSMKTMVNYLKHNWKDESNTYRPEHAHTSLVYKKPKSTTA